MIAITMKTLVWLGIIGYASYDPHSGILYISAR